MEAGSSLETLSEIAISMTGFAGIVGALAREKLRPAHPAVWLPFWAMIWSGLALLMLAQFPFLPYHLGVSEPATWVASSLLMTAIVVCNLLILMPRIWRAQRADSFPKIRALSIPLDVSSVLLLLSQVSNALGIGLHQSAGGFLVGLYLLLLISALNFVFLLYVLGTDTTIRESP